MAGRTSTLPPTGTRGGMVLDATPKIITPSRCDCVICFAGDTIATFPLMLHINEAIAAHGPAQDRNLDLKELKGHLLKVCTDIMATVVDTSMSLEPFMLSSFSAAIHGARGTFVCGLFTTRRRRRSSEHERRRLFTIAYPKRPTSVTGHHDTVVSWSGR